MRINKEILWPWTLTHKTVGIIYLVSHSIWWSMRALGTPVTEWKKCDWQMDRANNVSPQKHLPLIYNTPLWTPSFICYTHPIDPPHIFNTPYEPLLLFAKTYILKPQRLIAGSRKGKMQKQKKLTVGNRKGLL